MIDPVEFAKIIDSFVDAGTMTKAQANAAKADHADDFLDEAQFGGSIEIKDEDETDLMPYALYA